MNLRYSATDSKLTSTKLSEDILADIGRLVRAFAEIEDLVTLFIMRISGLDESQAALMLARVGLRRRIEIATNLAKITGKEEEKQIADTFPAPFFKALKMRNAVAHGTFLGVTEDNEFSFLTEDTTDPQGLNVVRLVYSYEKDFIKTTASAIEALVPWAETRLQLESSRGRRLQVGLTAHPKGRKQRKRSEPKEDERQSPSE